MTIDELLSTLETQTHAVRVQRMIELGKRARSEPETADLLSEMARGEWYQRFLALYACFGSLQTSQVLAALTDPSQIMRGLALRLLPLVCNEAELQQVLITAPRPLRQPLLWKLTQYGHQALIDGFVEQLGPADPQFCQLVRFASENTILSLSTAFRERAQLTDWVRLARLQPGAAVEMLLAWAEQDSAELKPSAQHINTLLPLLMRARPERSLHLLKAVLPFIPLDTLKIDPLAKRYPVEIAELVLAHKTPLSLDWQTLVPPLPVQQILSLCAQQKYALNYVTSWFPLLSQEKRLFIYNYGKHILTYDYYQKTPRDEIQSFSLLAALPRDVREVEARKTLRYTERVNQQIDLEYAVLLPWDEVQKVVAPYMHSSDAERRTQALFAQIEAVRYHRQQLSSVLEQLLQRRTEHDGVRKGILYALVALPITRWQPEHLPHLEEIIRHGLNDVGLSEETLRTMLKLLFRLSAVHFEWSVQQLIVTLRERGFIEPKPRAEVIFEAHKIPALQITPALRTALLQRLLPVMQLWAEQDKETTLLDTIAYLAPRGPLPASVTSLLTTLLQQTQTATIADRALTLLVQHEPQRFAETLPDLLRADASWITRPMVLDYLLRSRQDLLTPFLTPQIYHGRFGSGRKRFFLPLTRSATCLTASQQARFANALLELIGDTRQESHARSNAIACLALLPAIPPDSLISLTHHKNSIMRTTALFTLGRRDSGNAIPTLLEALQDSRARIAIIVLRPLLLRMPSAEALAILRTIPRTRVTVAKETMRLISDLASEEAYRELLTLEQSELHHDVRIALVKALWNYPHHAQTWTLMERVIQTPDPEIAQTALPNPLFSRYWKRDGFQFQQRIAETGLTYNQHILRLASLLLRHPNKEMRFDILSRYTQSYRPIKATDHDRILIPQLAEIAVNGKKDESEKAATALFHLCPPDEGELIRQVIHARLQRFDILNEMVDTLEDLEGETYLPLIRAALDVLATSPLTTLLRLRLAIVHLPAAELFPFFTQLAATGELHAEALMKARYQIDSDLHRFDLPTLEQLERQFASSDDERVRRLGLTILLEKVQRDHWTPVDRVRLDQYRSDSSLMIRTIAQFVFPEEEDDDDDEEEE